MSSDKTYKSIYDVYSKFYFQESSEEDFEKDKLIFQNELQRLLDEYDLGFVSFGES